MYTAIDSGWCLKKSTAVITGFSTLGYQMPSETKIQFCHFDMYTNLFTSLRKLNWNECGTFQVWMDIRGFLDQVSYLNFSFCSM